MWSRDTTINDLSDIYLHRILSFVSIKDAAITTVLSRRWYSVFPTQPILNFDDSHFRDPSTISKFFESMIAARDKIRPADKNPIVSLNLKCHHKWDIPKFVSAALNRGLENLTIDFCNSNLPLVLNTKTLKFLKLKSVTILQDPVVDLPLLEVLHLESVTFGHPDYLRKILCACPNIHDLVTNDLALTKLNPSGSRPMDTSLSKLVSANISGQHIYFDQLQNAEHLRLHVTWQYNISAIFHNLTYLDLTFHLHPLLLESRKTKWIWLLNLLYKFPKLQTLIIDECQVYTDNNYGAGKWEDREKQIAPDCLLYHLTTCSLRSIRSINCELQFAKYIMQNSRVLTTMKIQFAKSVETTSKRQMFNELSSINSARKCQLLFINLNDN